MRCVYTHHDCPDCGKHYDDRREKCDCGRVLRCLGFAVKGTRICQKHGGGYGSTLGIKNIKGGTALTSKSTLIREASGLAENLPVKKKHTFKSKELAERYEEALQDPELVALQRPLAVVSARVLQLLGRVEDGVTTDLWASAIAAYASLKKAAMEHDDLEIIKYINILDDIFKRVADDYKSWEQVFEALELQRKLSESERKRLMEMKQFITAEEAMNMVRALTAAIYKNVQDELTLRKIIYEFTRITGFYPRTGDTGVGGEGAKE